MIVGGAEVDLAPAAQAGVTEEMTTITRGTNPVVGGGEKEVMMKTAMMTLVAVIDTVVVENTNEQVERGANHPHRGIVIANVLKRREDVITGIIHLPATIAAAIAVLIATAAAAPPLHQGIVPNAVKNHARDRPKSPLPLTNRPPTTMCK